MSERYAWRGGEEMLLRHGTGSPLTLLVLPALFEESSRMRRFTVAVMRGLAQRRIGSILADLPGTGESLTPLADLRLDDWHEAVASLMSTIRGHEGRCLTIAIRGGALLDGGAYHGWRLAPETGDRLLRDLVRATAVTAGRPAAEIDRDARMQPVTLAGHRFAPVLFAALSTASLPTGERRTVRLADDPGACDVTIPGSRLWRAAEPSHDPAMAEAAIDDIERWIATCVG